MGRNTTPAALTGFGLAGGPGEFTGILPAVRLTPRDVTVAGLDDSRVSLDGTWGFVRDVPEGFDGTAASVTGWSDIEAPGHPALQGLGLMHEEMGVPVAYQREVETPTAWEGRRVILRFEGVDGLTRVWVNGQVVGENDIATLPSEYDVSEYVRPGETNEIVLTIEKSLVTRWSRRKLGGITRTAYLQALPGVNLARLHVDTGLGERPDAPDTVNAHVRVANQTDAVVSGAELRFALSAASGEAVAIEHGEALAKLPDLAPGQMLEVTVPMRVKGAARWTAETPELYTLSCELMLGEDAAAMTARQRFGFREVEVDGHLLLVNGEPVKLRGTNYHLTYPGLGESLPRSLIRRDLELFREANFNCLRSRPTPDYPYVELCDEMGIYTTVEAMISLMSYDKGPTGDHGADPSIAGPYRHHVATMIESYYSNPSVLTWGLGNECPYYDYFKVAAIGMHAADPTRPLFFGSDARLGVGMPFMDINDDHYPPHHVGRARGRAPAGGDPEFASLRDSGPHDQTPWPWSQDIVAGVTRDFRSTKFNVFRGGLVDGEGRGLIVLGRGEQHLHATPAGDDIDGNTFVAETHGEPGEGFDLSVLTFHNGGTEPHLTKSIRVPDQVAEPGWTLAGRVVFRLDADKP